MDVNSQLEELYNGAKHILLIGRAYQSQSIGLVKVCRALAPKAKAGGEESEAQRKHFSRTIETCNKALKSAYKSEVGHEGSPQAKDAFRKAATEAAAYFEKYGSVSSDPTPKRNGDIRGWLNELSEKDTFWANILVVNTNDRIEKLASDRRAFHRNRRLRKSDSTSENSDSD